MTLVILLSIMFGSMITLISSAAALLATKVNNNKLTLIIVYITIAINSAIVYGIITRSDLWR